MRILVALIVAVIVPALLQAGEPDYFMTKVKLPSGQTVVIAEGELEARSIGSFSVRLYDAAPPEDETTFFAAGLIRGRDGTIEQVILADVDDDGQPEIIIKVRSVGTGSYVSAHAFAVDKEALTFLACAEGLPSDTDPVAALRESISRGK
jgi:hypothetical protein